MARTLQPISFRWKDGTMQPINPYAAARQYEEGAVYRLIPHEDRSDASHAHYFATVNDAWQNLPEDLAPRFPTAEHLRKWCLIRAGYRDERSFVAESPAAARAYGAFLRPFDDYAVILVRECVVLVYTAKSQSLRAMGKIDFQKSKEAVLEILADLLRMSVDELTNNAGRAA